MSPIPGVEIQSQGDLEDIAEELGGSPEQLNPPEGNYWYILTITGLNERIAKAKGRAEVRLDRPANLDIASVNTFFNQEIEDSNRSHIGVVVGIDITP